MFANAENTKDGILLIHSVSTAESTVLASYMSFICAKIIILIEL